MGDAAGASTASFDELPVAELVSTAIRVHQTVDIAQVEAPHGGNRAFLEVTTSMNIKARNKKINVRIKLGQKEKCLLDVLFFVTDGNDPSGMVGTALGQLALKSHFNPVIAL